LPRSPPRAWPLPDRVGLAHFLSPGRDSPARRAWPDPLRGGAQHGSERHVSERGTWRRHVSPLRCRICYWDLAWCLPLCQPGAATNVLARRDAAHAARPTAGTVAGIALVELVASAVGGRLGPQHGGAGGICRVVLPLERAARLAEWPHRGNDRGIAKTE